MTILNELKQYSFDADNIDKILCNLKQPTYTLTKMSPYFTRELTIIPSKNTVIQGNNKKINSEFYQPQQKDTLFWCLYIIINGLDDYNFAMTKPGDIFKKERETRFQMSQQFDTFYKGNKGFVKDQKWKKTILESNLIYNTMEFPTFACCCSMHNYKLIIFNDCIKSIIIPPSLNEEKTILIHEKKMKDGSVYELYMVDGLLGKEEALPDHISLSLDKLHEVRRFDSPLLSISSYKKADLEELCGSLGVDVTDKFGHALLKKELYVRLQDKLKLS